MKTRYLTMLTTLAFLGFSVSVTAHDCGRHKDGTHKHCDSEGAIVYTAELTGAFVLTPLGEGGVTIVEVTPNSRENQFRSTKILDMTQPDPVTDIDLFNTWNEVFNKCGELLIPDSVDGISVGDDNWSIDKSGGVRVIFHDILLQDAEVTVQLIGDEFDFVNPFLPEPGQSSVFILDQFAIFGSTLKGIHPRSGCQPHGGGGFDIFPLGDFSTLVITATEL